MSELEQAAARYVAALDRQREWAAKAPRWDQTKEVTGSEREAYRQRVVEAEAGLRLALGGRGDDV